MQKKHSRSEEKKRIENLSKNKLEDSGYTLYCVLKVCVGMEFSRQKTIFGWLSRKREMQSSGMFTTGIIIFLGRGSLIASAIDYRSKIKDSLRKMKDELLGEDE